MKTFVVESLLGILILFLSVEILVRRWAWEQIPTPIGATPTYALLLVNAVVLALLGRHLIRSWASSKRTGRS